MRSIEVYVHLPDEFETAHGVEILPRIVTGLYSSS